MKASASVGALSFVTLPASDSVRTVVVLLHEYLMASWSAVQVPSTPKTQAPVLPEPGSCGPPLV